MQYEAPDRVVRKSMMSLNRRMRPMVVGLIAGLAGVATVFAGQALGSGGMESTGAMIALAGLAVTFFGTIWFVLTIGRREP